MQVLAELLRVRVAVYTKAWCSEGRIIGIVADNALQPVV
jgi:hypothetical protein